MASLAGHTTALAMTFNNDGALEECIQKCKKAPRNAFHLHLDTLLFRRHPLNTPMLRERFTIRLLSKSATILQIVPTIFVCGVTCTRWFFGDEDVQIPRILENYFRGEGNCYVGKRVPSGRKRYTPLELTFASCEFKHLSAFRQFLSTFPDDAKCRTARYGSWVRVEGRYLEFDSAVPITSMREADLETLGTLGKVVHPFDPVGAVIWCSKFCSRVIARILCVKSQAKGKGRLGGPGKVLAAQVKGRQSERQRRKGKGKGKEKAPTQEYELEEVQTSKKREEEDLSTDLDSRTLDEELMRLKLEVELGEAGPSRIDSRRS
ncbi:hypothetical protein K474DRAFT_1711873 [Panus rudis PR-1116 ss-1]|nr:hypothetical protein K474DRAFT_1711873 [Panus rudis PR-1116 ss-1]